MQQFGFSATDVKLKADETPKFGSNANIQPLRRYPLARRCLPNYTKASSLSQKPLPKQPVKTHPFGENCRFVKAIPQSR